MPISIAPSITSNSETSPILCPSVRGRPRALAQRPLPSMTIATWRGMRSRGRAGGRAPDACGAGGFTRREGSRRDMASRVLRVAWSSGVGDVRRLCGSVPRRGPLLGRGGLAGRAPGLAGSAPGLALHVAQRADPVLQVPLQVGGDEAAALGA